MRTRNPFLFRHGIGLWFWLAAALLCVLTLAGGASRADVFGQVVVRSAAWIALIVALLFSGRPRLREALSVGLLLAAALLVVLVQLVPLSPAVWGELPGRALLLEAANVAGEGQPWRPLAIVPAGAVNAASSLIVPIVVYLCVTQLTSAEHKRLAALILGLIAASAVVGLSQVSGSGFANPLVNDVRGEVSGLFANRNHFALFSAIGCVIAPVWAFAPRSRTYWRGPAAMALCVLFILIILASGSRAGTALGFIGLVLGLFIVRSEIRRALRGYPRWVFPALVGGLVALVALFILISVLTDRAVSINRALALDPGQDMRTRALPTIWAMVQAYFPAGSGFGGFDQVFRIHEPFDLLARTYMNHAHNDFLEIVLEGGLAGSLILAAALLWWLYASVRAWRAGASERNALPRAGSAVLLLVLIASIFDYPARTPLIMAVIVVAAVWLCRPAEPRSGSALPNADQHL